MDTKNRNNHISTTDEPAFSSDTLHITDAAPFHAFVTTSYRSTDALSFNIDPASGNLTLTFAARALDAMPPMFSDELAAWALKHFPTGSHRDLLARTHDYFINLTKRETLMQILHRSEVDPD